MTDTLLHKTVIVQPDFLDVGIAVETYKEVVKEKFFIYSVVKTWAGFEPSIYTLSERFYFKGTLKGLEQEIKLEFNEEGIKAISELYHQMFEIQTKALKKEFQAAYLVSVTKRM
ncbi:MAG: hypothetical protein PHU12_04135 [Candidatus Aenigmarchaeota archaeon]|jgi:hypothetical protein|nr:hypothetical protein [Candidatus Aenigmarchaeota archaeon]